MSTFSRFLPFLKPYLSRMVLAGLLVMGVAAINLALLRLAGTLWDIITVQHDQSRMTDLITVFLGLVVLQGLCSMGHSYLTAWISQRIRSFLSGRIAVALVTWLNRTPAACGLPATLPTEQALTSSCPTGMER